MKWVNEGRNRSVSDAGYQIVAFQSGSCWHYKAEGPRREREGTRWNTVAWIDPVQGRLPMKERYELGEAIPTEREELGYFREEDCGSAGEAMAAAVAACEQHKQRVGE